MYRRTIPGQLRFDGGFNVELNPDSIWVKLAELIPWSLIEDEYVKNFKGGEGQVAKSARLAFGALYIQMKMGLTDEMTRDAIQENPHLQYFCGMEYYTPDPPFDSSLMVYFRKRISQELIEKVCEAIIVPAALEEIEEREKEEQKSGGVEEQNTDEAKTKNRGVLILDATCCPQDIKYPTDIGLLNHARELLEIIIDWLFAMVAGAFLVKPRTYRKKARKEYLAFAKRRKPSNKHIRSTKKGQLQYVERDIRIVDDLIAKGATVEDLPGKLAEKLSTIRKLAEQQRKMYDDNVNRCDDRIVSIAQPHVRPIVRGKEHNPVEFGAKVVISAISGYVPKVKIFWTNKPEASLLTEQAEDYKKMFGFYPKTILGDRVYNNRENRNWCKERHIRLSGPRLGRKNENILIQEAKQIYKDGCERNTVESRFGIVKRKLGLDLIMTKLQETSETTICMGFFVLNMERLMRRIKVKDSQKESAA